MTAISRAEKINNRKKTRCISVRFSLQPRYCCYCGWSPQRHLMIMSTNRIPRTRTQIWAIPSEGMTTRRTLSTWPRKRGSHVSVLRTEVDESHKVCRCTHNLPMLLCWLNSTLFCTVKTNWFVLLSIAADTVHCNNILYDRLCATCNRLNVVTYCVKST